MTTDQIITKMVGRELTNVYPPRENKPGDEVVMEVKIFCSIHAKIIPECKFSAPQRRNFLICGLRRHREQN